MYTALQHSIIALQAFIVQPVTETKHKSILITKLGHLQNSTYYYRCLNIPVALSKFQAKHVKDVIKRSNMATDNLLGRNSGQYTYKDCKIINTNYSKEDSKPMLLDKKIRKLRSRLHQKMVT